MGDDMTNDGATIIYGLGLTGFSCLRHLYPHTPLMAIDTRDNEFLHHRCRESFPEVDILTTDDWPRALERGNRLVVSPGVPLDAPLVQQALDAGLELSSDIDLFLAAVDAPVIAITGTNGKSTVTTLVGKLLEAAGFKVGVGGNLGTPALDLIDDANERYVLELSSFQLERLQNPGFDVACVLNVTPDHLDRHGSFEQYAAVKQRIYDGANHAVYNDDDEFTKPPASLSGIAVRTDPIRTVQTGGAGHLTVVAEPTTTASGDADWRCAADGLLLGGKTIVPVGDLKLRGRHNHFNLVAGAAIAHFAGAAIGDMQFTLRDYAGLEHRAVEVCSIRGIRFINDSKATNVGATNAALCGFGQGRNIVLIAGGDDKGASFEQLKDAVRDHVIGVVLIGTDTNRLQCVLSGITSVTDAQTMSEAVALAYRAAQVGRGDMVLLSPACASFDMYGSYGERGDAFTEAVQQLRRAQGGVP